MADPIYALAVELSVGSLTAITSAVQRASYTRAIGDMFNALSADNALFEVANEVGSFSPIKQTNLKPGRRVALTATCSGVTYDLYTGRIKNISTRPMLGERTTVIEAATEVDRMSRALINTGIFTDINAGSLFTEIMSRSSVQSFAADALTDIADFAWYRDANAAGALQKLVESGYYQTYVDGSGTVNLRGRYFGAFGTSASTITEMRDLNYSLDDSRIINRAKMSALPRKQSTTVSTVAFIAQPITIPASSALGFFVSFIDPRNASSNTPVGSIVTPVSSTDYYAAANEDGSGSNLTSTLSLNLTAFGESAVCSLFNGGGTTAYLTRFQLRGYPILAGTDYKPQTDDSSSQAVYGINAMAADDVLFTDLTYLSGLTAAIVNERKEPRDQLTLVVENQFPAIFDNDVGDVLALQNSITGVNSSWTIRSVNHEISLVSGLEHTVTYTLEGYTERSWLVLNHATYGLLDGTRQLAL
jgi:hypothetical protein